MRLCYSVLLTSLVACGSDSPSSNQRPVQNVSMTDDGGAAPYAFSPATLTISVGTIVRWTNNGDVQHTSTSDATPQPIWTSGTVDPAGTTSCPSPPDPVYPCTPAATPPESYQRAFNTAGTFEYHCELHGAEGMTGTITVTP